MHQHRSRIIFLCICGLGPILATGCAVPQPRGEGLYRHVKEPTTGAYYHLYVPKDYVAGNGRHPNRLIKRWPLVMTFHGMKPYDNALPQEREWEKEADIYGYIVCAPELSTSDSFMEYPLTREHSYVLRDRRNVIAIMDHVFATTLADPNRVLSTSWSCGGYLAHYFPNRFPMRFSCIATRLSNFSRQMMVEETVPQYRNRVPVSVFIGDGDFPACKTESEEAVAWYVARGFRVVRGKMIDNMGHSRIPQTAAAFFAEHLGIEPLNPVEAARTVAEVQMTEYYPPQELIARVAPPIGIDLSGAAMASASRDSRNMVRPSGRHDVSTPPVVPPTTRDEPAGRRERAVAYRNTSAGTRYPFDTAPSYDPTPPLPRAEPPTASKQPVGERVALASRADASRRDARGNWLEPPKSGPPDNRRDKPANRRSSPEKASPTKPSQPPPSRPSADAAKLASARNDRARSGEPERPSRSSGRDFRPQDAGARSYGPLVANTTNPSMAPAPAAGASDRPAKPATARAQAQKPAERVRPCSIRLGGPAIGTSPHYLAYSVNLPAGITSGADFLWMDNGVWIGDEPRGVKILESPGLHRISVLVVTRDNVEYRGGATVQVLDRGPTAAAY